MARRWVPGAAPQAQARPEACSCGTRCGYQGVGPAQGVPVDPRHGGAQDPLLRRRAARGFVRAPHRRPVRTPRAPPQEATRLLDTSAGSVLSRSQPCPSWLGAVVHARQPQLSVSGHKSSQEAPCAAPAPRHAEHCAVHGRLTLRLRSPCRHAEPCMPDSARGCAAPPDRAKESGRALTRLW